MAKIADDPNDITVQEAEARFSQLEWDEVPNKLVKPTMAPVAPAPVTPPTPLTPPTTITAPQRAPWSARKAVATAKAQTKPMDIGEVKEPAKQLAAQEAQLATELGFDVTDVNDGLFYVAGTALMDIGEDTLRQYADEYKALPSLAEVADSHRAVIQLEDRTDVITPVAKMGVNGRGRLVQRGNQADNGLVITDNAWDGILRFAPKDPTKATIRGRKGRLLRDLSEYPPEKPLPPFVHNINAWTPTVEDKSARIRTRTHRGDRQAYAVFNASRKGYQPFDTDRVLDDAAKLMPNIKVEYTYDAESTRVRARCIKQAPIDIPAFTGVGRVHQIGVDLTARDDGGAIGVRPFLIRVRCRNATLVEYGSRHDGRYRHVGSLEELRENMANVLRHAEQSIQQMSDLWMRAAAEHYLDSESGGQLPVSDAFVRLIHHGYLPTCGRTDGQALDMYLAAWRAEESPTSTMGIIMAAQRAAHEGSWRTQWADEDVEEAASALLYSTIYSLDAVGDDDSTRA